MTSDPAPLAILSGVALLAASVLVATVRGEITAERYTIARCEQETVRVQRRSRSLRVELVSAFARWNPAAAGSLGHTEPSPRERRRDEEHAPRDWHGTESLFMADADVAWWLP